ncbi:OsmC family peroxiredoxin [Acidisphaera sp. L21]|uniref:OsmC family peroxiredoxin n=1 Tax=Acidisphaera sp. L21 TaxID=1641851 RepID=UPI00131BB32D|nr:OsmC family peroxiredoxin [Acidisphaera sp. L21]
MKAIGYATWQGNWRTGSGTISTETGTIKGAVFSFGSRFKGADGASPEELLAAAYAGCFNQALANNIEIMSLSAEAIDTSVVVEMGEDEEGHPSITKLSVTVEARVLSLSQDRFETITERARTHCSIAKVLRCEIGMVAVLL